MPCGVSIGGQMHNMGSRFGQYGIGGSTLRCQEIQGLVEHIGEALQVHIYKNLECSNLLTDQYS